jgi:hypothetical protein
VGKSRVADKPAGRPSADKGHQEQIRFELGQQHVVDRPRDRYPSYGSICGFQHVPMHFPAKAAV